MIKPQVFVLAILPMLNGCGVIGQSQQSFEEVQRAALPENQAKKKEYERSIKAQIEISNAALKNRCLGYQKNWQSAGYEQGKSGSTRDSYNYQLDQCKQFNLTFNKTQWDMGYKAGMLEHYCTYSTVFDSATEGGYETLRARCDPFTSVNKQQNMQIMYQKGQIYNDANKSLYEAKYRLENLNSAIDRKEYSGKTQREILRELREAQYNVIDRQREVMELEREAQRTLINLSQ